MGLLKNSKNYLIRIISNPNNKKNKTRIKKDVSLFNNKINRLGRGKIKLSNKHKKRNLRKLHLKVIHFLKINLYIALPVVARLSIKTCYNIWLRN